MPARDSRSSKDYEAGTFLYLPLRLYYYFTTMFLIMKLLLCAIILYDITLAESRLLFVERLVFYSSRLSGRKYMNRVFGYDLPVSAPCILGHVVDRGYDKSVESSGVHSQSMSLVENGSMVDFAMFLIFLTNLLRIQIPMII